MKVLYYVFIRKFFGFGPIFYLFYKKKGPCIIYMLYMYMIIGSSCIYVFKSYELPFKQRSNSVLICRHDRILIIFLIKKQLVEIYSS